MSVQIPDGRKGTIHVFPNDDPKDLATNFCTKYELTDPKLQRLVERHITDSMKNLPQASAHPLAGVVFAPLTRHPCCGRTRRGSRGVPRTRRNTRTVLRARARARRQRARLRRRRRRQLSLPSLRPTRLHTRTALRPRRSRLHPRARRRAARTTTRSVVWATQANTPLAFCRRQGCGRRAGTGVETRV